jgi:glycosyltransferase involved in cell wall biosynthesis
MRGRVTRDDRAVERAASTRTRELNIYAQADMVITVTEDDAHALFPHCERGRVRVIPNVHEIARPQTRASSAQLVFVGGFKHFPNVDAVTYLCHEILPLVRQRVPTVHLTIVGSNPPPEVWALREDHVFVTGFVPSTTPYLHSSRVSVAPLRFGAGMKGKIGEAMAHGVPVVTTTVGAQGMRLQHGINVLIADKPASFAAAVVDLLTDDILHDRITRNALDHLARHFTPIQAGAALTAAFGDLDALPLKRMPLSDKARFLGGWALGRIRAFLGKAEA